MRFAYLLCLFTLPVLAAASEHAFLKTDDRIVVVGDSISARGVYCEQIDRILRALYPDNKISIVNLSVGGQRAQGGVEMLRTYIDRHGPPTVALVMLGVNDTEWTAGNTEGKTQEYLKWIREFIATARKHQITLVFLTETVFAHSKPSQFVTEMNALLDVLTKALVDMARDEKIPVIDIQSAYRDELRRARQHDPRYEFSPDIIHPLPTGESCIAATLLRAFGVPLPLATAGRGSLRTNQSDVELSAKDGVNVVAKDGEIRVEAVARNKSTEAWTGTISAVLDRAYEVGQITLAPGESKSLDLHLPAKDLAPAGVQPLFFCGRDDRGRMASGDAFFQYSRIEPADAHEITFTSEQFKRLDKVKPLCPITKLTIERTQQAVTVRFQVADAKKVVAQDHFEAFKISLRKRQRINAPIDLESSPTWQPCDAIEFFFDLRPHATTSRDTSPEDANPEGVLRIGFYYKDANGVPTATLALPEGMDASHAQLTRDADNTYTLKASLTSPDPTLGFAVRVTDADEYKVEAGRIYYLVADNPMMFASQYFTPGLTGQRYGVVNFLRIGLQESGFFYRIGY